MHAAWIWGAAFALWVAFTLWYGNWRGALIAPEIDAYIARIQAQSQIEPERIAAFRRFLEADDGGEFFMVNLIRLHPEPVATPGSGERAPAQRVLEGYTGPFLRALLLRAGHPALAGPAAGRYLEQWNVAPDPGWTASGVIRYRSRRDLAEMASMPAFEPIHAYKRAAIASTFAFPIVPGVVAGGPRIAVPLALALAAALVQLGLRALRG